MHPPRSPDPYSSTAELAQDLLAHGFLRGEPWWPPRWVRRWALRRTLRHGPPWDGAHERIDPSVHATARPRRAATTPTTDPTTTGDVR